MLHHTQRCAKKSFPTSLSQPGEFIHIPTHTHTHTHTHMSNFLQHQKTQIPMTYTTNTLTSKNICTCFQSTRVFMVSLHAHSIGDKEIPTDIFPHASKAKKKQKQKPQTHTYSASLHDTIITVPEAVKSGGHTCRANGFPKDAHMSGRIVGGSSTGRTLTHGPVPRSLHIQDLYTHAQHTHVCTRRHMHEYTHINRKVANK